LGLTTYIYWTRRQSRRRAMNAEQNRGMLVDTTFADYRQPDNGEYIDDGDSFLSMDNLLESLDTMEEPWYQWADVQKEIMMEHIDLAVS